MKCCFAQWLLVFTTIAVHAQNLVPNPGFEDFSDCPFEYTAICQQLAAPWSCPSLGTSDLYNACGGAESIVGVPYNGTGIQPAHTGDGYCGLMTRYYDSGYREYIKAPLTEPLIAGEWYDVSFYVSVAENGCAGQLIGAYLTSEDIYQPNSDPILVEPQIETSNQYNYDFDNWILVEGCFQAEGGEQYILIGNFRSDAESPMEPGCDKTFTYYFIDDVSVRLGTPPEEIAFDLGGPEIGCFLYEIDPGVSGYTYTWEDGSENPTLVVSESGTYTLTITEGGCNYGIDSVEVFIGGMNDPVDVGPDQVIICTGETYTILLNPEIAEYTWNDGSHSPEYVVTETGLYSVTLNDGCMETSDQVLVKVLDPPAPFNFGDDFSLCQDDEHIFSFDPALGDYTWQDGNTSSTYIASTAGTYSLSISNQCGMVSDEIIINEANIPIVDIGLANRIICEGEVIGIEIDPQLGQIQWQDGSDQPSYQISTPGLYEVTVTNICGTDSDQMFVTVIDLPVANLGPDVELCEGDILQLSANNTDGTYQWQDNSSENVYTVMNPGTYSLTVTNECGSIADSISVSYHDLVVQPDLGPDVSLCPGESLVLHSGNPDATNLWQDHSTTESLLVTTPGTYYVEISTFCGLASDTIHVTFNSDPPKVDLPAQLSLCQGESVTLDASVTGVSYLWNDNSNDQQLLINTPGSYSITVSNACGTDVDTTVILDGGPSPAVELGNDVELCAGDVLTLSPNFSNVDTWKWQDGSTSPTYTVSGSGKIAIEVTNSCGTDFDTLQATLLPAVPTLDLGTDASLCSGEILTLSINTPGVTILWPDGSSDSDFSVTAAGPVYASIANSCGTSYDTLNVTSLPDVPPLNLGNDQSLCPGEIITLSPGINDVSYTWQDGSTGASYQAAQQETVILTISNDCSSTTDTLEITENTLGPQVDLGSDIKACEGEVVTIQSGLSGVSFLWQDGTVNPDFTTSQSGVFILNVSNSCGADVDTIVVDISGVAPNPLLGSDTTLCEGVSLLLHSSADSETSITWQDGSSQQDLTVHTAGTYSLTESNHCGDGSDTIVVSYLAGPSAFSLGADITRCPGEFIALHAPSTDYAIKWQDGSDAQSILADQAGTYGLQLSNRCGVATDELTLEIDTRVASLNIDPSFAWCVGDNITLDATQPFDAGYLWNTGDITPSLQITEPGLYSIVVSTLCSSAAQTIEVVQSTDCGFIEVHTEVHIPNIFSPNGDNINDVFSFSFGPDIELLSMSGVIIDRWGNKVFSSQEVPFAWDGYFNQERILPGVYVYRIECKYLAAGEERDEVFTGDVTVIR